jgi:hypothetical protein
MRRIAAGSAAMSAACRMRKYESSVGGRYRFRRGWARRCRSDAGPIPHRQVSSPHRGFGGHTTILMPQPCAGRGGRSRPWAVRAVFAIRPNNLCEAIYTFTPRASTPVCHRSPSRTQSSICRRIDRQGLFARNVLGASPTLRGLDGIPSLTRTSD